MGSKYDKLAAHLRGQSGSAHVMSFDEIDRLIKDGIPKTARERREWWDNDRSTKSRHYQSKRGWLAAGWEVARDELDLIGETVTFRK
jgi:hypothetical protein